MCVQAFFETPPLKTTVAAPVTPPRLLDHFEVQKSRLVDRFGFVANRPQIHLRLLAQRAVRPIFVVVLAPVFNRLPRVSDGEKPILIQALLPQSAVEAFDESIVCGRDLLSLRR